VKTLHSLIARFRPAISIVAQRIAFPRLYLCAALLLVPPCAGAPFEFEETGSLGIEHHSHTAMLLLNGNVIIGGVFDAGFIFVKDTDLYDPVSGIGRRRGRSRLSHGDVAN
jgi:hypothetical protein